MVRRDGSLDLASRLFPMNRETPIFAETFAAPTRLPPARARHPNLGAEITSDLHLRENGQAVRCWNKKRERKT
jgi:hypothetical protein